MTNMMSLTDTKEDDQPSLYMMPSIEARMDLAKLGDLLPDSVLQYCKSTQDVYESGNLTATRVMVQSALSAVFSNFLPHGNSSSSLSKTVQDSLPSIDIDLPLSNLASSLRKGEHLDALLNSPESASRETADVLMLLVEKLVSFLFVIPTEFEELNQRLIELSRELPANEPNVESDVDVDAVPDVAPDSKAA
ncbi:hypothetical protein IMCC3135_29230 [Granulosicoccus antarcticus IMCC3135]|uniref:Uncharacterized protein n=2 Tax=Granulosicoccus TaxID=437504 RepID=A0A2Z2P5D2_9GAMM|nr:hypothetical protein IMCC3135_29230 [Granulosicoccus antarcticus IMCC3135]